jgi:hypothetical protein
MLLLCMCMVSRCQRLPGGCQITVISCRPTLVCQGLHLEHQLLQLLYLHTTDRHDAHCRLASLSACCSWARQTRHSPDISVGIAGSCGLTCKLSLM